ncbi:MAG TPA: FtsX-like permease family protein [Kofleriaceae bacterium]|nr:FtsX-like permease family protein [Kofleriaceae bacterium]
MMPANKLARMVVANSVRSPRHFIFSAIGVVIGIGAFVLFVAGVLKVRSVLYAAFPLEQVEVIAPHTSVGGVDITAKLTQDTVDKIKARKEVKEALPRMTMQFPALGDGNFEGQDLRFEVGGFTDGIPPVDVAGDPKLAPVFKDWDAEPLGPTCQPDQGKAACPDRAWQYCDHSDLKCHHRVPVILSPTVLELYNKQIASSHGLPHIGGLEQFIAERGRERMQFNIVLGDTTVIGSNHDIDEARQRTVGAILVGISDKARRVGLTIPIGYVARWNREFKGPEAASQFSSIIVTLRDKEQLAPFTSWLENTMKLRLEDSLGEQLGTLLFVITIVLIAIAGVIVAISAINIAHNFFMQVSDRRREIGVLRAVGATQGDVMAIVLGEAAVIGLASGIMGCLLAFSGGLIIDWVSHALVPDFPFKPHTWFEFRWWALALGIGFATLFSVLGGLLPAYKASRLEPAAALAQN